MWPAEFDTAGMIRAERMPLGHAVKKYRSVGEVDGNGKELIEGQEGYYYQWYLGLHQLCGKEGFDAKLYKIRPSFETPRTQNCRWYIEGKAVV